jgi:VCBS repeat-containing protein
VAGKAVSIEYGRPSLKGRDMLGQAQIGQAWRMGSDTATTLKTEADLSFGSVAVPKGEYVLTATKVAADKWTLNVLSKADRSKVADVPLTAAKADGSAEMFTVDLKGQNDQGELQMQWGTTALKTEFTGK